MKVSVCGVVQGVGFRPYVFRLAGSLGLKGYVMNLPWGVLIEAEGEEEKLNEFVLRLPREKPPLARVSSLEFSVLDPVGLEGFSIAKSIEGGEISPMIPPDIAACDECLAEILSPGERRYMYPLTNCTNCGPRLSIINALPYDRPNTTMEAFEMCADCRREYESPADRRFHAQPIACPVCGPHVELWAQTGKTLAEKHDAMERVVELILHGEILAIKGLGGFLLVADARNQKAVVELRRRKRREEKPFALLLPSLDMTRRYCEVSAMEERLLASPESPVVLLNRRGDTDIAGAVAPQNPYLGVMLPCSPLHMILSSGVQAPLVATSGNLTDEPICTDNAEALDRLGGIADYFLIHTRPIARHVDDSVVRVTLGKEMIIRRARGYAPLPIRHSRKNFARVMGVGAHQKNTIALSLDKSIFVSQHIGDLETVEAGEAFLQTISDFTRLFDYKAEAVACDMHPDYFSTVWARKNTAPVVPVQHHHAHIASCMMENELDGQVLGVAWDGTGYGTDGTVWGGEFLLAGYGSFKRVAHLKTFRLPGSERSVKEPRRSALSVLFETFGEGVVERREIPSIESFEAREMELMLEIIKKGVNSPVTSSAGRLFDAVSSILGVRQKASFEGQGAMELEHRARKDLSPAASPHYDFSIDDDAPDDMLVLDWRPVISGIIDDLAKRIDTGVISSKFHNTLSRMIVAVARRVEMDRVVLSGGCFQNKYLVEKTFRDLEREGFRVYTHQRVPPNDGGISLGQVAVAGHIWRNNR
ncbi:MAG: carbamoyltransferase HypF [Candidatus Brocadiales bacterium]|nr:carbamoyltransferase HypF [Candidatus Bathyanammoxibius amoris]